MNTYNHYRSLHCGKWAVALISALDGETQGHNNMEIKHKRCMIRIKWSYNVTDCCIQIDNRRSTVSLRQTCERTGTLEDWAKSDTLWSKGKIDRYTFNDASAKPWTQGMWLPTVIIFLNLVDPGSNLSPETVYPSHIIHSFHGSIHMLGCLVKMNSDILYSPIYFNHFIIIESWIYTCMWCIW